MKYIKMIENIAKIIINTLIVIYVLSIVSILIICGFLFFPFKNIRFFCGKEAQRLYDFLEYLNEGIK